MLSIRVEENIDIMGYLPTLFGAYIGQTIHDAVKDRISRHLNGQSGGNRLVKRAIKKYGKDAFTYEILHDQSC